jgi:hypothetical protein
LDGTPSAHTYDVIEPKSGNSASENRAGHPGQELGKEHAALIHALVMDNTALRER